MHACFDKGMNGLPVTKMPPNVAHLIRMDDGQPVAPHIAELHASNFAFDIISFVPIFTGWLKQSASTLDPSFGLTFKDDPILPCFFVSDTAKNVQCCLLSAPCTKQLVANFLAHMFLKSTIIVYLRLLILWHSLQP